MTNFDALLKGLYAFIGPVIVGIVSGVISAILFHCILKRTSPKLKISDKIEKRKINNKILYHIKVVNLRRRFAVNVTPFLELVHSENGPDGPILRYMPIKVYAEDIPYIDPYKRKDKESKYAVRFEITNDLEQIWADDTMHYLHLRIYCNDAFSGSGKFFDITYHKRNCIVKGAFKTGKSVEIVSD